MLSFLLAVSIATMAHPHMVVTTDWLAENVQLPGIRVLDVTTVADYNRGHIPGAVFVNINRLMVRRNDLPNELPPVAELEALFRNAGVKASDKIILTSSDPLYATRAWFTLDYLGWGDRASILDGGNGKWSAERHPITAVIPMTKPGDFAATVDPKTVIGRDELKALLASNTALVLLDARDTEHFLGKTKGVEVTKAGHIPTADCFPATANLKKSGKAYVLKDTEQLEQMYGSLGVSFENQRIVVYCRSGVEATMNYFVLRYLGFHPTLYDGSYVDWSKTEAAVTGGR